MAAALLKSPHLLQALCPAQPERFLVQALLQQQPLLPRGSRSASPSTAPGRYHSRSVTAERNTAQPPTSATRRCLSPYKMRPKQPDPYPRPGGGCAAGTRRLEAPRPPAPARRGPRARPERRRGWVTAPPSGAMEQCRRGRDGTGRALCMRAPESPRHTRRVYFACHPLPSLSLVGKLEHQALAGYKRAQLFLQQLVSTSLQLFH